MSAPQTVAMPLPERDFDPTESAVTWKILKNAGYRVIFATPEGNPPAADPVMVTGKGLGLLAASMRADRNGREAYAELERDAGFAAPVRYAELRVSDYAALALPGGHAKGMRPYLEAPELQRFVADFVESGKPVGAICHGVLLAARSRSATTGRSVLAERRMTGLPRHMEMLAWNLTRLWMSDYYRTYATPLEDEVRSLLSDPSRFEVGPRSLKRDSPGDLRPGFTVRDGNLLTARWPGDAHRFGTELAGMIAKRWSPPFG